MSKLKWNFLPGEIIPYRTEWCGFNLAVYFSTGLEEWCVLVNLQESAVKTIQQVVPGSPDDPEPAMEAAETLLIETLKDRIHCYELALKELE